MNHKPHEHTFDKDGDLSSCTKCGLIKKTMTSNAKSKAIAYMKKHGLYSQKKRKITYSEEYKRKHPEIR